jgi:hypothetical protein
LLIVPRLLSVVLAIEQTFSSTFVSPLANFSQYFRVSSITRWAYSRLAYCSLSANLFGGLPVGTL